MLDYLKYLLGYAEYNEYEADEKSKRQKYLCCQIIKSSNIKLKKVNNITDGLLQYELNRLNNRDFPKLLKNKRKRTRKI